jgi:hypothetical protein
MVEQSSILNPALEKEMTAVGEVVPGQQGGRPVLVSPNGQSRIALPMAYVESCVSKVEEDFLWRFFEAYDFADGNTLIFDDNGPIGRYADHAENVDPESYVRMEVEAFRWVRQYGLGREWATIAELFLRMMADRAKISVIDWGGLLTNSDESNIALGGAQVSFRMLGIRLKDAYRDFFRWYRYVHDCQARGEEPTGQGAYASLERERRVALDIQRFKRAAGLPVTEQDGDVGATPPPV